MLLRSEAVRCNWPSVVAAVLVSTFCMMKEMLINVASKSTIGCHCLEEAHGGSCLKVTDRYALENL